MNTQNILTGVILLSALVYAVWMIVKYFGKPKPTDNPCDKFAGDCAGCKAHFSSFDKNKQECDTP